MTRPTTAFGTALLCATTFLVLGSSSAAPSQERDPSGEAPAFFDRIGVDIVNVDVYVTDAEGNPVEGLTRDDFVVTEDGEPVEVLNFYSELAGEPSLLPETQSAAEPQAREDSPASAATAGVERVVPESQRLNLIVYVDNFNINALNRNRVFGRLRAFLRDHLRPGDEVMIASYDRSLHIRLPFGSSAQEASQALLELEGFSGMAIERESERADAIREIYETDSLHKAQFRAKQFADNQYQEVGNALEALSEMIDSLGGLPGRKMLIHVSDGIPMVPGQDLYQAIQQRFADQSALLEAFSRDLSRQYMRVIAEANSNRVSFYTIDGSGLQVRSGMGAENAGTSSPTPISIAVDGVRTKNLQGSLKLMAEQTGGQSILNTNDVREGLERVALDFGNYYSLGYRAPTTDRGRFHSIEVRLKNPGRGWKIRHRGGYRDKSVETQMQDSAKAFLIHGYQTNPLAVSIDVGDTRPLEDGNFQVPIRIRVPVANLVLLPRGEFYEARLLLYFGASDAEGREAPLQELPFDLRIPASAIEVAKQDEVARVIDATMRRGPHKVVVAVRDEIGAEQSVVGQYLMVAGPR